MCGPGSDHHSEVPLQGVDQFYSKEDITFFVDNVDSDVWKAIG